MTGSAKLEKKLLKNPSARFSVLTKALLGKKKDLQNVSNKDIHVTLQSDNTKHRPFQFISWSNFIEGFKNLSPCDSCLIRCLFLIGCFINRA